MNQTELQKLMEMKGEIDKSTTMVGDLNIPFSTIGRKTWQKICENMALNKIINQQDRIDICRTLLPITREYTYFSGAGGTYSRMNHIVGHSTIWDIYKNWNHRKCTFWWQWKQTRSQWQKDNRKRSKYLETNHILLNNPLSQRGSIKGNF